VRDARSKEFIVQASVIFKKSTHAGGYLLCLVGGEKVLCHADDCDFSVVDTIKGDVIEIGQLDPSPRGLRGLQVSWVSHLQTEPVFPFEGTVTSIQYEKKFAHAAVDGDDARRDVFCHVTDFLDYAGLSASFDAADRGSRVRGYFRETSKGRRGHQLEIV